MRRRVMGPAVWIAKLIGLGFIVLAALSLLQLRFFPGNVTSKIGLVAALALGLVGVVWLVAVQIFLHFFDQFLSRN